MSLQLHKIVYVGKNGFLANESRLDYAVRHRAGGFWLKAVSDLKSLEYDSRVNLLCEPGFAFWVSSWWKHNPAKNFFNKLANFKIDEHQIRQFQHLLQGNGIKPSINHPLVKELETKALRFGVLAGKIAQISGRVDPDWAIMCTPLALICWWVVAACEPKALSPVLGLKDSRTLTNDLNDHWKIDSGEMGQRLIRRMGLPDWVDNFACMTGYPEKLSPMPHNHKMAWHVIRVSAWISGLKDGYLLPVCRDLYKESCKSLGFNDITLEASLETNNSLPKKPGTKRTGFFDLAFAMWASSATQALPPQCNQIIRRNSRLLKHIGEANRELAVREDKISQSIIAEMAAGAGHEINNPLAILMGRSKCLIRDQNKYFQPEMKEEAVRFLVSINDQAQRIHSLIKRLIKVGRPGNGIPKELPFIVYLKNWITELESRIIDKAITVRLVYPKIMKNDLVVYFDQDFLKTILDELWSNSIQSISELGEIILSVEKISPADGCGYKLCLANSGPPIEAHVVPHIFEPFFSHRKAGRGSGLGLPLARSLARVGGGDLVLANSGKNSQVKFALLLPEKLFEKKEIPYALNSHKKDGKSNKAA